MRLVPGQMLQASFVERPNRFLIRCLVDGSDLIEAQLPNPGRLTELLLPGATLYLADAFSSERSLPRLKHPSQQRRVRKRRTRYTVWGVEREDRIVLLHTQQTNAVARYLIEKKLIPTLRSARILQAEVPLGRSRFDFLMEEGEKKFFLEVKSVTLFGNGAAMFPDAVTERGRHHLLKLAELGSEALEQGFPKPTVLFLVHSDRTDRFLPDYHTDFAFSRTFLEVRDRVRMLPVSIGWTRSFGLRRTIRELPIPWAFLKREVEDRGTYLLLLRIEKRTRLTVGRLGELDFPRGWYVYVGSARAGLAARLARHLRRRKRFHWHIDYLRDQATEVAALPIRSSRDDECNLADSLSEVLIPHSKGFGSSDCSCRTHLYFSAGKPLHSRQFHEVLERFRMPVPSP